ncbi:MAG: MATE family efflux transporter, partial [Armatimonadetes bacterium]|nr:MATE family efflux transporter [Armatimonadota bacterium]
MSKRTSDLGEAPLGPLMVKLSIPGMIGMLVMSVYNIVDTLWVSGLPYGTEAIAALTVLFPFQMIAMALGMGVSAGATSLVSRRFGAGRAAEANQAAGNAISLALALGAFFALLGILYAGPVVRAFGATPEIVGPSIAYLTIVAFGFPFQMFAMTLGGLYRGSGNTVTPMAIMACSAVTNAALDPFLIYGWGPFPELGIRGAAVATLVAQFVAAGISFFYLRSRRSGYHVRANDLKLHWGVVRDIAEVGLPASAMMGMRSVIASVYNWVLAGFGPEALAAHGLSHRVIMLVISVLGGGVHTALMPITGYSFGAKDYRRLWRAYKIAAVWTSGGAFLLTMLVWAFCHQILTPFAREAGLLSLAILSLRIRTCTLFLVEPQMMAIFTLQGMGMGT